MQDHGISQGYERHLFLIQLDKIHFTDVREPSYRFLNFLRTRLSNKLLYYINFIFPNLHIQRPIHIADFLWFRTL